MFFNLFSSWLYAPVVEAGKYSVISDFKDLILKMHKFEVKSSYLLMIASPMCMNT